MFRIGEWLARTTMLVLAALATLALIGSLASVSNSPVASVFPGEIASPVETGVATRSSPATVVKPGQGRMTMEPAPSAPSSPTPAPEVARWLKALTYAVIALAVFAAAGVFALVRIARHLRDIAAR